MGRYNLQKVLDKKYGKGKFDLEKFKKDPLYPDTIKVPKKPGQKETVDMQIREYARQLTNWLSKPRNVLTDEQIKKNLSVDWLKFYRMNDIQLISAFPEMITLHHSLKTKGLLGEDEKNADAIVEILTEKIAVMGNPYFNSLNPEVFDDLSSSEIDEILADPGLSEEEPALYEDNDLDGLTDQLLDNYLAHIRQKKLAEEKLMKLDLDMMLRTTVQQKTDEIEYLFSQTLAAAEDKEAVKDLSRQIIDNYKLIIGCKRIAEQTKNQILPHDQNKLYEIAGEKHMKELTSDISDKDLVGLFDLDEAEILEKLKKDVPVEDNPAIAVLENFGAARKWFNSLNEELLKQGVDISNPLTAGLIQVRNDITEDYVIDVPEFSTSYKSKKIALDRCLSSSKYALIDSDINGNPKTPFDNSGALGTQSEWLVKNSVNAETISEEHILYLYNMAKQNRLMLKSIHPDTDKYQRNEYLKVSENGSAMITKPMIKLIKAKDAGSDEYKQYGFTEKEFDELAKLDTVNGSLEESVSSLYYGTCTLYSSEIAMNKELGYKDDAEKIQKEYDAFKASYSVILAQREILSDATRHPQWYKSDEDVKLRTKYYSVGKSLPEERSQEDVELIKNNPVADRTIIYIEEELLKMTNCKDLNELMQSGKITDENGKAIKAENDYEFLKSVYNTCLGGNNRIIIDDKKYVYDASGLGFDLDTVERSQKLWFDSLQKTLTGMGYDSPMSFMMLRVRGNADHNILNELDYTFEGGIKALQLLDQSSQPALMPVDQNGNLKKPLEPGQDPVDWVYGNMPAKWSDVSKEQIEYLYNMAKANRLYLQSDEASVEKFGKNQYISVSGKDAAHISKPLDELEAEFKKNPNQEYYDVYDKESFKALSKADGDQMFIEYNHEVLLQQIEGKSQNIPEEKLQYQEALQNAYYQLRDSRVGLRDACANAHMHGEWYKNKDDVSKLTKQFINAKKQDRIGEAELALLEKVPVANAYFQPIEKGILKKSGYSNIADLMKSGKISFGKNKPVKAENTLEFLSKVTNKVLGGNELFIDGKSFFFSPGYGFKDGINLDGYVNEAKFLVSRLIKTEGNLTKNTPEYDKFSEAAKKLPDELAGISCPEDMNFEKLQELIKPVIELSNKYIEKHQEKPLDSRQIERVKVINRFKDLANEMAAQNTNPGKNIDYRIAEKLFSAAIVKLPNGSHLLMDEKFRATTIKNMLDSQSFKNELNSHQEEGKDWKMELLKTPGKKLFQKFSGGMENIFNGPQENREPAQLEANQ